LAYFLALCCFTATIASSIDKKNDFIYNPLLWRTLVRVVFGGALNLQHFVPHLDTVRPTSP
jgi:hypothetical protein